ncbi:hypothetical protein [Albidovulum sp.]|uniref:hypothetical protein n=1 Tax=Albidovulum sp. TaxID=1872424 RepID=UPI0039B870D3
MRWGLRPRSSPPGGAGAAALAALMQERGPMRGRRAGVILSGGNIDSGWFCTLLAGGTPEV